MKRTKNTNRFLLIDDSPRSDRTARQAKMFCERRMDVTVASSLLRAVTTFRETEDYPSVILINLGIKQQHAFELLAFLKQHEPTRDIPVVVLVADREQQRILSSYDQEVTFLFCPSKPRKLANVLSDLVDTRHGEMPGRAADFKGRRKPAAIPAWSAGT